MKKSWLLDKKTTRYFKELLLIQMEELLEKADRSVSEALSVDTRSSDPLDIASDNMNTAFKFRIRDRENKLIKKIKHALNKIESGEYGICEICEEEISFDRLKARPVAALCIDCKIKIENEEKAAPWRGKQYNKIWETYIHN